MDKKTKKNLIIVVLILLFIAVAVFGVSIAKTYISSIGSEKKGQIAQVPEAIDDYTTFIEESDTNIGNYEELLSEAQKTVVKRSEYIRTLADEQAGKSKKEIEKEGGPREYIVSVADPSHEIKKNLNVPETATYVGDGMYMWEKDSETICFYIEYTGEYWEDSKLSATPIDLEGGESDECGNEDTNE